MSSTKNTRIKQLLLVLAGVVVLVLIMLAPKRKSQATEAQLANLQEESSHDHEHEHAAGESHDDSEIDGKAFKKLSESDKKEFEQLEEKAEKVADIETKLSLYDSLIAMSIKRNLPPRVALYSKKKAEAVPTENNWLMAGDNYFKAFRLSKQQSAGMAKGAVNAYQEVLKLNEGNLKAKTALGVAYVEGASALGVMPMKGIGMLKEVINIDPKNVDALTNLGYFAIQSGQYEKAVERFETILQIDPKNAEAYIYLTDVYLSQDQVDKGIETLEKYKSLVEDPLVKQQVDEYINEIKNS